MISNTIFRRRGLPARFLYSMPKSLTGRVYNTQAIPEKLKHQYKNICYSLLDLERPEIPQFIYLSEEAQKLSERFFHEIEMRRNNDLEPIKDFIAKLHGNIARIAGILHIVDNYKFIFEKRPLISGEVMQNAINIGYYFLEHAIAAFQQGDGEQIRDAKYILKRLEKSKPNIITKRELIRLCRKYKSIEQLDKPLSLLTEYGYFKELDRTASGNNRQLLTLSDYMQMIIL